MEIVGRAFASVADMVRNTCDSEFADEFDEHLAERRLSKIMTVIRCGKVQTQAAVAEKMGCGQAKVSKMERTVDRELNFGDIVDYSRALGQALHMAFMPASGNSVDHIRFHMNLIKHELKRLVTLAGDDRTIGNGVEAYAIENLEKYVSMIDDTINKLPHRMQQARSSLCVEAQGEGGQRLSFGTQKRVRKATRKHTPAS